MSSRISIDEKFGLFSEHWRPKVIAALNGQEIKLVKVKGEFPWHHHEREEEFFLVWKGRFRVEFRDRIVELGPGECVVVPRGVEHRTCADAEAEILLFEPAALPNTGNVTDAVYTAPDGVKI
jgi:mannose-6-phosphate isomerase-like protein (cupin superfamily)